MAILGLSSYTGAEISNTNPFVRDGDFNSKAVSMYDSSKVSSELDPQVAWWLDTLIFELHGCLKLWEHL